MTLDLATLIRAIPDFPKPGIMFRDITPLLQHPTGLRQAIAALGDLSSDLDPGCIVGIESRGFIFGTALACHLGIGFVPVRKPGKLPAATYQQSYDLEYGSDALEIHQDAFVPGQRVLVVDDLIATGGTAQATADLVTQAGAELAGFVFAVELSDLGGRSRLPDVPVRSLLTY